MFFAKNIFSQKFSLFPRPQNPKNRDLADMDPWFWTILGMCTPPYRPDLDFLDFEVSKKVRIFEKKIIVGSSWVEILRLAHSFGLWGCLGCSKHRQFHENHQNCHFFVRNDILAVLTWEIHYPV